VLYHVSVVVGDRVVEIWTTTLCDELSGVAESAVVLLLAPEVLVLGESLVLAEDAPEVLVLGESLVLAEDASLVVLEDAPADPLAAPFA